MRRVAADVGISEGYAYRLAREGIAPRRRRPWALSERAIELYYDKRAQIAEVRGAMVAEGADVPGLRQLQRAFATQLDSDERAFVRWGVAARRARSGTLATSCSTWRSSPACWTPRS